MQNQFKQYGLSREIIEALDVLKYKEPTKIQQLVIPEALKGKDVVAKSMTGSGKTAAFAIPICEQTEWEYNEPQVLVLEPTRELTVQVKQEIFHIGRNKRLKVPDLFGGFPIDKQILTLKQKSHIVTGTPGRTLDHIRRETLHMERIHTVIIDEADLMLDMGFIDDVRRILKSIPHEVQIMLFSATLGEELEKLIAEFLKDPVYLEVEQKPEEQGKIEQKIYEVGEEEKYKSFLASLEKENPDSCMIFCGTRQMVDVLCRKLRKEGVRCGMIHGEIEQQDRIRTIEQFREGRFRYLIATDVVARGIDFDHLTHVFNYDFPTGKETYVHRIGRTGRNGETGVAVSFVTEQDKKMKKWVEGYIGHELPYTDLVLPSEEDKKIFYQRQKEVQPRKKKKGADFAKTITKLSISGGKKSKMRAVDIVGTLCSIDGIKADDIGVIDIRDSLTYVEILNSKGDRVLSALQKKTIKGKLRKVRKTRSE